ncbi:response regulator [Natronorubrum sp. JWXQ-INN-674]|uniref:Response regulator n=1 Tax=Natronorubrum halalkaliphilum TaxID=2691917 RepID=A0A6B0VQ37_9EURY|nr:response regulator [Natronorubrum halalkaliphilum]MXV63941.1 response regulator [Natronorubrum halalkaliphilum]
MPDQTEEDNLPRALVVDDEREVADAYALRLRGLCDVRTTYAGDTALEILGDEEIDIVLLDRHMPGLSGDEVLAELDEREYYGRIVMVTAIDPGFDVLDMPFDDYLCKPVEREDVRAAVEQQCAVLGYETLGAYFQIEAKRSVLEAELPATELADRNDYRELADRAEQLRRRANRLLDDPSELLDTFDAVGREGR